MFAGIPWFSTFTLFTEAVITACILVLFYRAYFYGTFMRTLAALALSYETLFNVSYMAFRFNDHVSDTLPADSHLRIGLAIFHGTFSLLMFVLLVAFLAVAWRKYETGTNYFREHRTLTIVFLCAWMVAILSGFVFYYVEYFLPVPDLDTSNMAQNKPF